MERSPVNSPERKKYGKYVPFEDVGEVTNGRFQFNVKTPPYIAGQIGVDVKRVRQVCNFTNIGNMTVSPSSIREIQFSLPPDNPDGSSAFAQTRQHTRRKNHAIH